MWEISIKGQALSFVLSCCLGAGLCIIYDLLRAMRKAGFNSFWAVFVTDIIFWVLSAFLIFIFLIARTNGEIRGYILLGVLFGFFVFRLTFSKIVFKIFCFIFKYILFAKDLINKLLKHFYAVFETLCIKLWVWLLDFFNRIGNSIKKLLKNSDNLLYTDNTNVNVENVIDETKA